MVGGITLLYIPIRCSEQHLEREMINQNVTFLVLGVAHLEVVIPPVLGLLEE